MGIAAKRNFLIAGAAIAYLLVVGLALILLYDSKLSGAEFVALIVAFAVLCAAVGFAPEIQEVSIAGNVVKLREVKAEAIKTIESLKRSRVESHRALLKLALKTSGAFSNTQPVDPRNSEFCRLIELAREYECVPELKSEILSGLDVLLLGQVSVIHYRNRMVEYGKIVSPVELAHVALDDSGLLQASLLQHPGMDVDGRRAEVVTALEEYSRIYDLKRSVAATP